MSSIKFRLWICWLVIVWAGAANAGEKIGGHVPVRAMRIDCSYVADDSRVLEGFGYRRGAGGPIKFASISDYRIDQNGKHLARLGRYRLTYIPSDDLSLIFRFENRRDEMIFEAFGDDMGGMSSIAIRGNLEHLTCSIEMLGE